MSNGNPRVKKSTAAKLKSKLEGWGGVDELEIASLKDQLDYP